MKIRAVKFKFLADGRAKWS